jgi:[1-hydroxy-2-(trimethylamino)ethyl]phosphonate dioxygenase
MTIVDDVAAVFFEKGESSYFGEPVSQLEHALQTAHFARRDSAPDYLIAAALLHDVGHLVQDLPEDIANHGIDARHEDIGESWLAERFGPEVYQPVAYTWRLNGIFVQLIPTTYPGSVRRRSRASSSRVDR